VDSALGRQADGWSVRTDDFWCHVTPRAGTPPAQGWKLHVSATMLSAPLTLARVAAVLVKHGCAFKFVARLGDLWALLAPHADRASAGKFVTVYPDTDDEAVRLAALLHEVTFGLPGPRILSDQPYRPGSVLHYRYGAFAGYPTLAADGFYERRLRTPAGTFVADQRLPWFSTPPFAVSPFPADPPATGKADAVTIGDRFIVRKAVHHANRGGVYVAEDQRTGQPVIIKEARPHTASDLSGSDARDRLANEGRCLEALAGTRVAPGAVTTFEQQGHHFLVTELIEGTNLRRWQEQHAAPLGDDGFGVPAAAAVPVVERLVDLVDAVHRHGLTIGDLTPNNLMVRPDGELRIVDLEGAAAPGTPVLAGGTPGYVAPELVASLGRPVPAPGPAADLYSLGAVVSFLAVGAEVPLAGEELAGPDGRLRIGDYLTRAASANPTLAILLPLVRGLLTTAEDRWSLDRCRTFLAALRAAPPAGSAVAGHHPAPDRSRWDPPSGERLVDDVVAYLTTAMRDPDRDEPLWHVEPLDPGPDPCAINAGAAGMLGLFTSLLRVSPRPAARVALAGGVRWLQRRLSADDTWPPGLYFGRAGCLWALFEAAEVLGDPAVSRFACTAARRLPVADSNPDVTHGLAGGAMTLLRLGLRSGDAGLLDRAGQAVDNLCAARSYPDGHPQWTIPEDPDTAMSGVRHIGYAHGIAGIGTALLYAGAAMDRPDLTAAAGEVARALYAFADVDGDTVWWPVSRHTLDITRPRRTHWCSGSSGIGSFLIRYWRATGDATALDLAGRAANAVHRNRWQAGTVPCHGLPGDAELLLDLATFTGDDRHRRRAQELADCLSARSVTRRGLLLVPARNFTIDPTFLGGAAGTAAFLLRLLHPHPRPWMLDDLVWPDPTAPAEVSRGGERIWHST
jgi:serine/threonine protein kinase